MAKKAQVLAIEEEAGEKFPDLESAQRAALPSITESLQDVIRNLLKNGTLINVNGKLVPADKDQDKK